MALGALALCMFLAASVAARPLSSDPQAAAATTAAASGAPGDVKRPVLLGDGSVRVMTRSYFRARPGGALAVLGRPTLVSLKRSSKFVGSIESLAAHLDKEKDLGVDAVNSRLMYQCKGLTANVSAGELEPVVRSQSVADADAAEVTQAQAFALSSRPGAAKTILLDFNGHTTTGTRWNTLVGRETIVSPAYDKDGNPAAWSADELRDITAIWRAVAEDFSLFDVDVTTADPGDAALAGKGMRVVIGGSYADWYNSPAGGVAYVSSFGEAGMPCFVFPANLGPNFAKYIWEATSHELGHTLGLLHAGVTGGSAYYSGQGDWAPIMGTSYYKQVSQWSKGEYAGSNNPQDNVALMASVLPLLRDGFGDSMATATPLNASVDAATGLASTKASGVVSSAAGDFFSFQAAAGTATLSASVVAPWSGGSNRANLDIQLVVYDAAGAALATLNPAGSDAASLGVSATPVALPASGTYYVAVTGAGASDAATTGYSAYASRGQFELSVAAFTPCANCGNATAVQSPPAASPPSVQPTPSSPSPSPSPAPLQALRVTSISLTKVPAGTGLAYCSVTVYVRNAANTAVSGVRVNGRWSASPTLASFAAATANMFTGATGTVAFRSSTIQMGKGFACIFSIGEVSLAGFYLDSASSKLKTPPLTL